MQKYNAKDIIQKLKLIDELVSNGCTLAEALESTGVTQAAYNRWRSEYCGLYKLLDPIEKSKPSQSKVKKHNHSLN